MDRANNPFMGFWYILTDAVEVADGVGAPEVDGLSISGCATQRIKIVQGCVGKRCGDKESGEIDI